MFSISSGKRGKRFCDGLTRRDALQVGAMGFGGLTLADLLRAEARAETGSSHKALINIHLSGGPSHQDMFDLKPEAPREFRGEFEPVATNVSGIDICEHMPRLAQAADKFAIVRSLTGSIADHSDYPTQTGFPRSSLQSMGGRPSIGSVAARMHGSTGGAPPFVGYNGSYTGYLSSVFKPYKPQGGELKLNNTLTANRLQSRTDLLVGLDRLRRDVDHTGHMLALDAYTQQAVDIVTSGRVADALDPKTEDPRVRDRYGKDGNMFLTARRLIEAGVRVVNFSWGSWDTHSNNFNHLRGQLPRLDHALHALIEDLSARGMEKDVTVVVWGEFGRTPRVNKNKGGRDHWYEVASCFLAGGGMKTGQVVGKSNRNAERAVERPVHLLEVFATMYHNLGIDVRTATINDPGGRPQYLTDGRMPIHELI
ncbi:MAG TPA: DUF1501 domain-containing protein [Planctomycetaceae bacterium]|nr:DUF1501 domain-containing protein [Planctomycetaceae bacterium]HCK55826.1 DUF1501 domain-containing protein [Planctomycetaceae bacterium]